MQSASLAADGMLVYEIRSPHAKPVKLGSTVGDARVSVGSGGRLALPGGVDRIAWVRKAVLTCSVGRCTTVRAPAGSLTLDPAWSPDGTTLALVSAGTESTDDALVQPTLRRWYATRRLWLLSAGSAREVPGTMGAAAPTWSRDNTSLLFVADDSVWLLPRLDKRPVRIAGPLFGSGAWPNDDGQIAWSGRFAWQS